jgi:hypothetical protein
MIQNYFNSVKRILGSLISNARAREGWGKGIYLSSFLKIIGSPAKRARRAGKKKRGSGGNEFLPARSVWGWEAARLYVSKEAKPAKIVSLIEKIFCARPLKELSIFAGFVRRQATSRWVGLPPAGRQSVGVPFKMSSNFFQQTPPY